MNERIQKLYKETTGKDWVYDFDPDYAEKFAELIVRECIETIQNESMNSADEWENGLLIAERAVREHFGVEE